jgi:hypothetical protein
VDKNGGTHTNTQADFDLDGKGDACDIDADGDSYNVVGSVDPPATDCNDLDAAINPGRTEVSTNEKDDDCNPATPDKLYDIVVSALTGTMVGFAGTVNYDTWLPTAGGTATITAKVVDGATRLPLATQPTITFILKSVTAHPGTYLNNDSGGASGADYTWSDPMANPLTFNSLDYGGRFIVHASARVPLDDGSGSVLVDADLSLPKDSNNNDLGDAWEAQYGGNLSRDGDPDGDGLTNLEEYRAPFWGQLARQEPNESAGRYQTTAFVPAGSSYQRTNPTRKDLFLKYTGFEASDCAGCPFAVGAAFFNAGIDVHAVAAAAGLSELNLDVLAVVNQLEKTYSCPTVPNSCGHTSKVAIRNWNFDVKGNSNIGDATAYADNTQTYQKALNYYFVDRPYLDDPNFGNLNRTKVVLDKLSTVEDANDNGVYNTGENTLVRNQVLEGDKLSAGSYTQQGTAMDINSNGLVELPSASDPSLDLSSSESTMSQVIKHTVTHEMGHAIGMIHNAVSTCVMYNTSNNWRRDHCFSSDSQSLMQIHNQ